MQIRFDGRTAIVTGAAHGFGRAIALRLAALGAHVVACDVSEKFLAKAREKSAEYENRIEYRLIDATEENALLALGERKFDAAVCSMALMDMPATAPLMAAMSRLLKPSGRFVFSVLHPCFNSDGFRKLVEEEDRNGEIVTTYSVQVIGYIRPVTEKGLGVIGQPVPQYYFHRPLNELFRAGFQAGLVLDALEEPVFDETVKASGPFSWENYREIPPVLIARMRPANIPS